MIEYIYYILGYQSEEIKPDENQLRLRHVLLKQIRNSNLKLRPINSILKTTKNKRRKKIIF